MQPVMKMSSKSQYFRFSGHKNNLWATDILNYNFGGHIGGSGMSAQFLPTI